MRSLLLILSLVFNAAAVWGIWIRPAATTPPIPSATSRAVTSLSPPAPRSPARPVGPRIEVDSPATLRDHLRAAGFPPELVKAIVAAHLATKYYHRTDRAGSENKEREFWQGYVRSSRDDLRAHLQISHDYSDALRNLFGSDINTSARRIAELSRIFGPIAPEKIEMLDRLQRDYGELMMSYRASPFRFSSDLEELAFLDSERKADLAALLTPAELTEFELRTSETARQLQLTTRAFNATEEEFRQLYPLWEQGSDPSAAFSPFVINGPDGEAQRQQLLADAAAVLSPERLADLEQSLRIEAQFENATVTRLGLPLSAAKQLFEARMEVSEFSAARQAAQTQGADAVAARAQAQAERGQQLWTELVDTFGEEVLNDIREEIMGDWLRRITPAPETPPPSLPTPETTPTTPG